MITCGLTDPRPPLRSAAAPLIGAIVWMLAADAHASIVPMRTEGLAALRGSWSVAKEPRSDCRTTSFEIVHGPAALRVTEQRICGPSTFLLNYTGQAFCAKAGPTAKGHPLLAVNPTPADGNPAPLVLTAGSPSSYKVDRLTLWLSGDGCRLTGVRSDGRSAPMFHGRRACSTPPRPPCD